MATDVETYIAQLRAEAKNGFHYKLKAWVGDDSSVVRVLRDFAAREGDSNE